MRAIIIDDEEPAREGLRNLLRRFFSEIKIVGEADSVSSGVSLLNTTETDIAFLDINLFDGSGFNILEQLDSINFHVIFVTAYDNYAIKAFKVSALDYILKPIDYDDLVNAVIKVKKKRTLSLDTHLKQSVTNFSQNKIQKKLSIIENDGIRFVLISDIIRCQADDNYTKIYLMDGDKIISSKTLKEYDSILVDFGFFRVHRSHLVNLKQIKKILKKNGTQVLMVNNDLIEVSRRKKDTLTKELMLMH